MKRKIAEEALYGDDKSFAISGSDSCGVYTCHRMWQSTFIGALTLGMRPVHEWDCRTGKSDESNRMGKRKTSSCGQ